MTRDEIKQLPDKVLLAMVGYGEAANQSLLGIAAVMHVVMNRVRFDYGGDGREPDWWGEGIPGVITKPWQFSFLNPNDSNRERVIAQAAAYQSGKAVNQRFRDCLDMADMILAGLVADPTKGATAYYADYIKAPTWATRDKFLLKIGCHLFFAEYGL